MATARRCVIAVDWIKMRTDLQTHRKVRRIASALSTDKFRAIGLLHAVWSIFDAHSVDGSLDDFTPDELDEDVGVPGVARAMESVGWLNVGEDVLSLPDFDEHNGQSAKRRATEARRKKKTRNPSARRPPYVRKASAPDADTMRTREEKRREEKSKEENESKTLEQQAARPRPPKAAPSEVDVAFAAVWDLYPRKLGRHDARRHFGAQVKLPDELPLIEGAVRNYVRHIAIMGTEEQFILHGSTFFNHRWREYADGTWTPPTPSMPGRKVLNEGPPEAPHHPRFVS